MSLGIFETIAFLASYYILVWGYFTLTYWLDRRAAKRKAKEEFNALPLSEKAKHMGKVVAKSKMGDAAKKMAAPVVKAANKSADIINKTVDGAANAMNEAAKATNTVSKAAQTVAQQKVVKQVASHAKKAGNKVVEFFRVEPIEDDEDKDDN